MEISREGIGIRSPMLKCSWTYFPPFSLEETQVAKKGRNPDRRVQSRSLAAGASTQIAFSCFLARLTPASHNPWRSNLNCLPSRSFSSLFPPLLFLQPARPASLCLDMKPLLGRTPRSSSPCHILFRSAGEWMKRALKHAISLFVCLTLNSALLCEQSGNRSAFVLI